MNMWGLIAIVSGCFALVASLLFNFNSAQALTTVPTKMNFQGRLTDSTGNIKPNGTYNMRLKLYTVNSGGSAVWSEDRLVSATQGITLTNGLFAIQLGDITSLPASLFASGPLYLEIELPTPATATSATPTWTEGPMTPRNQLATSAYAYNSETLDGIDSDQFAREDASNTFTAAQTVNVASTAAFDIQNGSAVSVFKVNTSGASVTIGTSDTTGTLFVLDTKTDAGDPTGVAGAMYYNSNLGKFRCYQGVAWADCIGAGGGGGDVFLANANTFTNTNTIATTSATAFRVQSASGAATLLTADTSTMAVTLNGNLSFTTGKTITLAGDTTLNRPASPTEGMIYYDTTTKKLEVYANGKWQADRTDAILVAASNSSQADKDAADYVADGDTGAALDGDQVQINSALTAGSGKKVVLLAGTYVTDATILIPNNTTFAGVGNGTVIELADIDATDNLIENSDTTTGTGVTIRDMKLDGRKDLNTLGTQSGISFNGMGSVSGVRKGATISGITIERFNQYGIYSESSYHGLITGNYLYSVTTRGIYLSTTSNMTVSDNYVWSGSNSGIDLIFNSYAVVTGNSVKGYPTGYSIDGTGNVFTGNSSEANTGTGVAVRTTLSTFSGNTITGSSANYGFNLNSGGNNTITGNTFDGATINAIRVGTSNNAISGNRINNSGSTTTNNAIYIDAADNNSITSNTITDSSATTNNFAINIFNSTSDTNYLADNTLGGGTINDAGTGTKYANQLNSSDQYINRSTGGFAIQGSAGTNLLSTAGTASVTIGTSDTTGTLFVLDTKTDAGDPTGVAGAMYYNSNLGKFRCYQGVAWVDCISSGGATLGANTFTGAQVINASSTAAFDVQNGSGVSVFKVDSSTSTVTIGTATNGSVFTSTGLQYAGTARPTRTITLVPEYAGATFTGDGTNNTGSLGSDFCSSASLLNIPATSNPCTNAADEHNFYTWTTAQGTAQDYDIYVRYQIPSDYDTGSMTNLTLTAQGTNGTNEGAVLAMFKGSATACTTLSDAITANATWATATSTSPLGACTIAAGDMVTFRVKLSATSNGVARAGTISLTYRSKF